MSSIFSNYTPEDLTILEQYNYRNKRVKEDQNWLKEHKPYIVSILQRMGKPKTDIGNFRVQVSVSDNSKFDMDKVAEYLESKGFLKEFGKLIVDEEKLVGAIDSGVINLDELKEHAWLQSPGIERLIIKDLPNE